MSPEAIAGATAPSPSPACSRRKTRDPGTRSAGRAASRRGVARRRCSTAPFPPSPTCASGPSRWAQRRPASSPPPPQLARRYGLPIRSVGGATESKTPDVQAGFERMQTLLPAVLARVANLITCGGRWTAPCSNTTPCSCSTTRSAAPRRAGARHRGQRRDPRAGPDQADQPHGQLPGREAHRGPLPREHWQPRLVVREPWDTWEKGGAGPRSTTPGPGRWTSCSGISRGSSILPWRPSSTRPAAQSLPGRGGIPQLRGPGAADLEAL